MNETITSILAIFGGIAVFVVVIALLLFFFGKREPERAYRFRDAYDAIFDLRGYLRRKYPSIAKEYNAFFESAIDSIIDMERKAQNDGEEDD